MKSHPGERRGARARQPVESEPTPSLPQHSHDGTEPGHPSHAHHGQPAGHPPGGVHAKGSGGGGGHRTHHGHMVADFQRRFWVSLVLTAPVLALAPMIQQWLGLREVLHFAGDSFVAFGLPDMTPSLLHVTCSVRAAVRSGLARCGS